MKYTVNDTNELLLGELLRNYTPSRSISRILQGKRIFDDLVVGFEARKIDIPT